MSWVLQIIIGIVCVMVSKNNSFVGIIGVVILISIPVRVVIGISGFVHDMVKSSKEEINTTRLLKAIKNNDFEKVLKLSDKAKQPSSWVNTPYDGLCLISYAVQNDNKDMVTFLIEKGAYLNFKESDNKILLDYAKNEDMIVLLKKHGTLTRTEIDELERKQRLQYDLNNDLLAAIKYHDRGNVEALISKGADVNCEIVGLTPLICAVIADDIEIIKLLVSKGADINREVYIAGRKNALQYARIEGKTAIADFLEMATL